MPMTEALDIIAARLTKCLSALKAELDSNISAAYTDANKRSEVITRDLMNILYDKNLVLESKNNASGFDLCDSDNMLLVQITSNHTIGKITDCLRTTTERVSKESALRGFDLQILFLTTDGKATAKLRTQTAAKLPKLGLDLSAISFDPQTDILDFNDLLKMLRENHVTKHQMAQLTDLMDKYWPLTGAEPESADNVQEVIDLYVENFKAPLFMHRDSKTVTLKNLYVEPAFTDPGSAPSMDVLLEDFIHRQSRESILLIEGGPAIGKTSLVSWMCYHHAHPTEDNGLGQTIFGDRSIVVVRLRELEFPTKKLKSDAILRYLNIPSAKAFSERYPGTILILDGADELGLVSNARQNAIEDFIVDVQQSLSPFKTIVTSRPKFLNHRNLNSFHHSVRHVTLMHFDDEKRAKWVENYKSTGEPLAPETEAYILDLDDRNADGVADTPLALYLLADCKVNEDYKNNQWSLYHAIFSEAITKAPYNAIPGSGRLMSSEHAVQNYDMVKAIAFRMFQNSGSERFYINKDELDDAARNAGLDDADAQRVKETCVLCAYWKDSQTGTLEFYHNNIRDFFLAEYFCDKLLMAFSALPVHPIQNCSHPDNTSPAWNAVMVILQELFCWTEIYGSNWNHVFTFIHLRLLAESKEPSNRCTLYSCFTGNPAILQLMNSFANSTALWNHSIGVHPYLGAKAAFSNVLIIFNILLRHFPHLSSDPYPVMYSAMGDTLLRDWSELFMGDAIFNNYQSVDLLHRCHLNDVNWADRFLAMLRISNSYVHHANLSVAQIQSPVIRDTVFENSSFEQAHVRDGEFCETQIINSPLPGSRFSRCNFRSCTMHEVSFKASRIYDSIISDSSFITAYFAGAKLKVKIYRTSFVKCHFSSASISYSHLENVVFRDTDFCVTTIRKTTLTNCRFEGQYTVFRDNKFSDIRCIGCTYRDVSPETAEILRSIGFTEDNTPYERTTDYDSESDSV